MERTTDIVSSWCWHGGCTPHRRRDHDDGCRAEEDEFGMAELTEDMRRLAKRAGLDVVIEQFPNDVAGAAASAAKAVADLPVATNPADEPWPPMRVMTGA
jgi:hypothetical protein